MEGAGLTGTEADDEGRAGGEEVEGNAVAPAAERLTALAVEIAAALVDVAQAIGRYVQLGPRASLRVERGKPK
jgi:hypothetical protein